MIGAYIVSSIATGRFIENRLERVANDQTIEKENTTSSLGYAPGMGYLCTFGLGGFPLILGFKFREMYEQRRDAHRNL